MIQVYEVVTEIPGQSPVVCQGLWTAGALSTREQQPLLIIWSPSGYPRVSHVVCGLSTLQLCNLCADSVAASDAWANNPHYYRAWWHHVLLQPKVGAWNPEVLTGFLEAPEVSGTHLGVSALMVGQPVGFRVGKRKREDNCDIPNFLWEALVITITNGFILSAKGTNSEPKCTSSPR